MDIEELIGLVQLHGKSIYRFCAKLTGNKEDADDLYQETFLKAVELRHKLDAARNPRAFLVSIAALLYKNHRRKLAWRHRIAPLAPLEEAPGRPGALAVIRTPEDELLSLELRGMLQAAAHQLNDRLKIPLYMHYAAEMTVDEIAAALKIPPGTVKSRLHKARKIMRSELEAGLS